MENITSLIDTLRFSAELRHLECSEADFEATIDTVLSRIAQTNGPFVLKTRQYRVTHSTKRKVTQRIVPTQIDYHERFRYQNQRKGVFVTRTEKERIEDLKGCIEDFRALYGIHQEAQETAQIASARGLGRPRVRARVTYVLNLLEQRYRQDIWDQLLETQMNQPEYDIEKI